MQSKTTTTDSPAPKKSNGKGKIPTAKQTQIIILKNQNPAATSSHIAALAGADISYTIEVLRKYGLIPDDVEEYKNARADILAGLQGRILKSITQEDIQKAPLAARMMAIGISFDKERLERDKSTSNIIQLHGDIAQIRDMRDKINIDESAA